VLLLLLLLRRRLLLLRRRRQQRQKGLRWYMLISIMNFLDAWLARAREASAASAAALSPSAPPQGAHAHALVH
jgi:hypothetical protein